ncbi:MAG: sulfite exporter TauE/SafE family protein [Herbaspirillum sp.]|nr:sulfite exporter TauE/SafE family protein [Herbaspirillum sp.]
MNNLHLTILFVSSILAGLANALAGGGTFFSFPALIAGGLSSLIANATNAVAVTPGHALAAFTYRDVLGRSKKRLLILGVSSALGAIGGAYLLTITSVHTFDMLVPWLLLFATVSFAAGPYLQSFIKSRKAAAPVTPIAQAKTDGVGVSGGISYFLASIYGGYFGAGQGIVLMTILTLSGIEDVQEANALKNAIATIVSLIAVIVLAFKGFIIWKYGLLMIVGATIGGLYGGKLAKRLSKTVLRTIVIVIGTLLTGWYFYKS